MAIPPPPTSYLPPIAKIASYTSTQLLDALAYLKLLFNPEVHGSHRMYSKIVGSSPVDIQWCCSNEDIARMEGLLESIDNARIESASAFHPSVFPDILMQEAASLLAICSGVSAAGTVEHIFSFGSGEIGRFDLIASSARKDCRETVAATDFYPSVLGNLRANIDENFAGDPSDGDESVPRLVEVASHAFGPRASPSRSTLSSAQISCTRQTTLFGSKKVPRTASTPSEYIASLALCHYLLSSDTPQADALVRGWKSKPLSGGRA
ncbi:hypothetical protein EDD15DRAFT_2528598 [Pisolithus albus]|nr:hypothetical protein EDD15DRAFT_2528598 [Pisolithus albus]